MTLQLDTLADTLHSSMVESVVNTSSASAAVDDVTSGLSAITAFHQDSSVMIPVHATQPLSAVHQSVTEHHTRVTDTHSAQLMV